MHKVKVVLKELRETFVALKIIKKATLYKNEDKLKIASNENDELIAIFVATVKTARGRKK
ncbi:MAG: hypothetical protein K8S16_12490 [Bacteroidales bacterium]|nr:hypothetical protein [Bacteroidales bacterium]